MKSELIDFFKAGLLAKMNTDHGRFNLICDIVLAIIAITYTASDVLKNLIFASLSAFKTWTLHQDILNTYKETNFLLIAAPCVLTTIICFLYLSWHEDIKKSISGK